MTHIVQRKDRFYVVADDGTDPLTGRERRRWHPVGHDRTEAETIAARLGAERIAPAPPKGGAITVGEFLTHTRCRARSLTSAPVTSADLACSRPFTCAPRSRRRP